MIPELPWCSKQKMPKTRSLFGSHIVGFPVGAFRRTSDEFEKGQRARVALVSDMHEEAERILLAMYAPAGVLINAEIENLQFRGDTGPCLTPALADKSEPAQDG